MHATNICSSIFVIVSVVFFLIVHSASENTEIIIVNYNLKMYHT